MMTLLTSALQKVGIKLLQLLVVIFTLGTKEHYKNGQSSGFDDITMWYQPMVVSFDDPLNLSLILLTIGVTSKIFQKKCAQNSSK